MNRTRKRAARLALYLECAGVIPIVDGSTYREFCASLLEQYCSRPIPVPVCDLLQLTPGERRRVRAEHRERVRRWPQETPPCPRCRIASGMPKRSWPSRERAEEARSRQKDPRLHVYPCPAQPGLWHLGHLRKGTGKASVSQ
jgi:hypothetical protein